MEVKMPSVKVDMVSEAMECQELFKDDPEAVKLFKDYEMKHREADAMNCVLVPQEKLSTLNNNA